MYATWYVLDDGSVADPNEVAPDDSGVLRHRNGVAVAMGLYGARSRGVNLDDPTAGGVTVAAVRAPQKKAAPPQRDRQMKAGDAGPTYETR